MRLSQCKACPWKRSTVASRDIPNGYDRAKHEALKCIIAVPPELDAFPREELRLMACHETPVGAEVPCAGWVFHQLGPGNNIMLRLWARKRVDSIEVVGEQCETFEETLR